MNGPYAVRLTTEAADDVKRLFASLAARDRPAAVRARDAIRQAFLLLRHSPFSCRKSSDDNPLVRELVIPFGSSGYVALFEIDDAAHVTVLAVRHQRESDYH